MARKLTSAFPPHLAERACTFAAIIHGDQYKYGDRIPYLSHVMGVVRLVSLCTGDPEVTAAAALHDSLEKGGQHAAGLRQRFSERVGNLVEGLSEPPEGTWEEKKDYLLRFLKKGADNDQLLIACADKADNVYSLLLLKAAIGKGWEQKSGTTADLLRWYHETALEIFSGKAVFRKKAPSTLLFTYSTWLRELFPAME